MLNYYLIIGASFIYKSILRYHHKWCSSHWINYINFCVFIYYYSKLLSNFLIDNGYRYFRLLHWFKHQYYLDLVRKAFLQYNYVLQLNSNFSHPSSRRYYSTTTESDNHFSSSSTENSINSPMKRVLIFNDCLEFKSQIMKTVKGFGGVYIFQNTKNGKRYVGSSLNLRKRLYNYYESQLRISKGQSIIFNALNKYGHKNFSVTIILIPCATRERVLTLEQYIMDTFKPEYNILIKAGSPAGMKFSPEARAKVSLANLARGWKGVTHPSWNTGKIVYLYELKDGILNLHSTFPNLSRMYETLQISRTLAWRHIKRDSAFLSQNSAFPGQYKAYFEPIDFKDTDSL